MLVQLIGRETAMEVKEVEQHESPSPNTVYITPPNRNLLYRDGRFELIEPIPNVLPKPSVNSFFYSVAAERGEEVIGVILSGTGSDGAGGVRAIKAGGGLVFAQDPASAKYAGMPQSAIETDCVDWVLTPDAIAREIALIVKTQGFRHGTVQACPADGREPLIQHVAVERVFFQVNVRTAMSVGQASGLAMAEAVAAGCEVVQYSPNEVKLAVTGDGAADKQQVQMMVQRLLGLAAPPRPADAADAAALALCHLAHAPARARIAAASAGVRS